MAQTLFDKIWDAHTVADLGGGVHLIYIDRVFLHERTGSVALKSLEEAGRPMGIRRRAPAVAGETESSAGA